MMVEPQGFFITGTDTGVGKTVVAAALALAFQSEGYSTCVFKPIETGCRRRGNRLIPGDAAFHARMLGLDEPLEKLCPVRLRHPLAPITAAGLEGVTIRRSDWLNPYRELRKRYDTILVEGAGGLMVPIRRNYLFSDLAAGLGLPVIIVARTGLGTINHTLLTIQHARERGLDIAGVIFNRSRPGRPGLADQTGPEVVRQFGKTPVFGLFPFFRRLDPERLIRSANPVVRMLTGK